MAVTVTASYLGNGGTHVSAVRAMVATAATGSIETYTILHRLGVTPHRVSAPLRSIISTISGGTPVMQITSYDITKVVLEFPLDVAVLTRATFDVICENIHSFIQ